MDLDSSITAVTHACHAGAVRARLRRAHAARPGPGSVSWKINREMIVVAGWGRAILLQLAHPAVAAGVDQHSSFRGSVLSGVRRLHSTVGAMLAITFGSDDEMVAAAAGINVIHDRVRGRVRDGAGGSYSAHDPDLQRWVHATLLESIPLTYERLVAPLTARERDLYCAEAAIMEPLLGIPAGWLPRSSAELHDYMSDMLANGGLTVTPTSRALARAMLFPRRWRLAWPLFRPMQLMTIASLPASIRDAYGFAWRARDERALRRWTACLRILLRALPAFAHVWPMARRQHSSLPPAPAPAHRGL